MNERYVLLCEEKEMTASTFASRCVAIVLVSQMMTPFYTPWNTYDIVVYAHILENNVLSRMCMYVCM